MALLFPGREQAILPLRKLTTVNLNYACEEDYKQLMSFLINWKSFKKLNTQILKLTPINSVEKDTVVERDNFFKNLGIPREVAPFFGNSGKCCSTRHRKLPKIQTGSFSWM